MATKVCNDSSWVHGFGKTGEGIGVVVLQGYWELEGTYMLDHCPW